MVFILYFDKNVDVNFNKNLLQNYDRYSWLWTEDRLEYLVYFLRFGRVLSNEEKIRIAQAEPDETFEDIPEKKPSLIAFQDELDRFIEIYNEIDAFNEVVIFEKWLRINTKPVKYGILNAICEWSNILKNHLIDHIKQRLVLKKFICCTIKSSIIVC